MSNKKEKIFYKQKKYLLLYLYTLSMTARVMSMNNEEKDIKALNVKENVMDTLNEEPSKVLADINMKKTLQDIKPYKGCAGIAAELLKCLTPIEQTENIVEEKQTIYYDFACSEEMQDYIFQISEKYNVPFEIIMVIIERESGGRWHTNGIISSTNDYGLTQINEINHKYIEENLGFTSDDLRYDPYKSIEAQAFLLKDILDYYQYTDEIDYRNVFGTYNGWLKWYEIKGACEYADACMEILEEKFSVISRKR